MNIYIYIYTHVFKALIYPMNDPALFHPALRHSCRIPLRSSRGAHLLHRSCVYEFHTTSVALVKKTAMVFSCRRCWNDVGTMLGTMLERCWERCWNDVGTMFYFTFRRNRPAVWRPPG